MTHRYVRLPIVCLLLACGWQLVATDSIPLSPTSAAQLKRGEKLEVEQVEVRRFGAIPAEIHRKAGRFLLLVTNHDETDPAAAFQVDSSAIGNGKIGPNPMLRVGESQMGNSRHRSAGLLDAVPGDFDLKYADTGKIVCKIKID